MEKTVKCCATQPVGQASPYQPPTIDTLDVTVERGFQSSVEKLPDTPWE